MIKRGAWLLLVSPVLIGMAAAPQNDRGELPDGDGRDIVVQRCTTSCHPATALTRERRTRDQWRGFIGLMRYKGAGVVLSDEELRMVLGYLQRHFGKVNVNGDPKEDLQVVLDIPIDAAAAVLAYRAGHGDFQSLDDLARVPGLTPEILEARKNRILFKPW
jgi:helix-hairpin-helix protein